MDIYRDFVVVESFNRSSWNCDYYSCSPEVKPTSDAPLYHTALIQSKSLPWDYSPIYMLHGHAFETEQAAHTMGIPISSKSTLFSTPEDSEALFDLMKEAPFPESQIYIRKGHGFVLIGRNPEDVWDCFEKRLKPYLGSGDTSWQFLMYSLTKYLPLLLYTVYNTMK